MSPVASPPVAKAMRARSRVNDAERVLSHPSTRGSLGAACASPAGTPSGQPSPEAAVSRRSPFGSPARASLRAPEPENALHSTECGRRRTPVRSQLVANLARA